VQCLDVCVLCPAVDFFNQINMLYGTITEFCTEESCPVMSAGRKYEYHWADGQTVKKPIKCSAPKYIDYLMSWVQCQLDDEALFPSRIGLCITQLLWVSTWCGKVEWFVTKILTFWLCVMNVNSSSFGEIACINIINVHPIFEKSNTCLFSNDSVENQLILNGCVFDWCCYGSEIFLHGHLR